MSSKVCAHVKKCQIRIFNHIMFQLMDFACLPEHLSGVKHTYTTILLCKHAIYYNRMWCVAEPRKAKTHLCIHPLGKCLGKCQGMYRSSQSPTSEFYPWNAHCQISKHFRFDVLKVLIFLVEVIQFRTITHKKAY